ncbi:MAG: MFS transporter [Gammaproteobacteria bacterium]
MTQATIDRISRRLLPILLLGYLISLMDRSNISYASVQMNADLGFSAAVYGLGAGLFFAGYAIFEVPSNLLLVRFGARRWIARIMLTWGLISMATMFVRTPEQFYLIRFLLGAAEAGFVPGVLLYLSYWFPSAWRGRAISRFNIASPLGTIVMGSIAGALLGMDGWQGLHGWQWLFLIEGLPAVLMAWVVLVHLPDTPSEVGWLSPDEKAWLARTLAADTANITPQDGFLRALLNPLVLAMGLTLALCFGGILAISYSGPSLLIAATGWSMTRIGLLLALGGALTLVAMLILGWSSDRFRERPLHMTGMILLATISVFLLARAATPETTIAAYLLFAVASTNIGMLGFMLIGDRLHPGQRAVGFAAVNTLAQIGSFAGPALWGVAAQRTGGFQTGLAVIPLVFLVAAGIVMAMRKPAGRGGS